VYKRTVLETISYHNNSHDFIFDTKFLAQAVYHGFRIGDIPIPTRRFPEAFSINFRRSLKYGSGCLAVMLQFVLERSALYHSRIFEPCHVGERTFNAKPSRCDPCRQVEVK
jgi:hypothetical protein